jgi:DEAD/DEAH box helicase domain-containing protein
MNVKLRTFDGDTKFETRKAIINEADIIFTNPDMLHISILPNLSEWRDYLMNLKYVVVDGILY